MYPYKTIVFGIFLKGQTLMNWIPIQFNNWIKIQLKTHGMENGGKAIQNLLVNMVLEKNFKNTQIQKDIFPHATSWFKNVLN